MVVFPIGYIERSDHNGIQRHNVKHVSAAVRLLPAKVAAVRAIP